MSIQRLISHNIPRIHQLRSFFLHEGNPIHGPLPCVFQFIISEFSVDLHFVFSCFRIPPSFKPFPSHFQVSFRQFF